MTEPYVPIDCGLHSEYELLAMRCSEVRLSFVDESGELLSRTGRITDVFARSQAEFLVLAPDGQPALEVRLDRVRGVSAVPA